MYDGADDKAVDLFEAEDDMMLIGVILLVLFKLGRSARQPQLSVLPLVHHPLRSSPHFPLDHRPSIRRLQRDRRPFSHHSHMF